MTMMADFLEDSPPLLRSLFCGTISSLSGIESRGDEGTKGPSLAGVYPFFERERAFHPDK